MKHASAPAEHQHERGGKFVGLRKHHRPSDLSPSLERLVHRHFVGVLEIAADRHAHRDARHLDAERLEQPRQIDGRRLALDVRVGREDDLGDAVARRATAGP